MLSSTVSVRTNKDAGAAVQSGAGAFLMDMATVGFDKSQEVIADEATDTGQLLQSGIPPERLDDGSVQWGYAADYAEDVNDGQEPHWIEDIEPLKGWARRVLGSAQLAYPVRKKIAEKGTEGVHFIERSKEAMNAWASSRSVGDYIVERL